MKIILFITLILISIISVTLYQANFFINIEKVTPKSCRKIANVQGPEDIEHVDNKLFISMSNLTEDKSDWIQGGISSYDIDKNIMENLTATLSRDLNIHGMKAIKSSSKAWTIYAINHGRTVDEVLKFSYSENNLRLIDTISSPLAYNLNDIEFLNNESFVVTKDHFFKNLFLKRIENFLRIGISKVLYFDGNSFKELNANFTFANGITLVNKTTIAVASMITKKVEIYNIENIYNLKKTNTIELDFFPDNLSFNEDSNELIIAGHYKLFTLKQLSENPRDDIVSPSKGISVNLTSMKQKVILSEDSSLYSGVSVIKKVKDKYYIGFIYKDYILECLE